MPIPTLTTVPLVPETFTEAPIFQSVSPVGYVDRESGEWSQRSDYASGELLYAVKALVNFKQLDLAWTLEVQIPSASEKGPLEGVAPKTPVVFDGLRVEWITRGASNFLITTYAADGVSPVGVKPAPQPAQK